jgi:hypothetical protein
MRFVEFEKCNQKLFQHPVSIYIDCCSRGVSERS